MFIVTLRKEVTKERFIQLEQNKIRYLEDGKSSDTIILVHGLGASAERWQYVIPYFSKKYHVIIPDLIGFGYSDKPIVDYTINFFVKFLVDFLDSLEIKKCIMIGSSLGGQIVAEFAMQYSQILKKMILVSPSGFMEYSTPTLEAYMMAAFNPDERNTRKAFEMMYGPNNGVAANEFLNRMKIPGAQEAFISTLMHASRTKIDCEKLSSLSIPTLIVWGTQDVVIPPDNAKSFFSCLTNCSYVEMAGCGHVPYVDKPEDFSNIVLEFLSR